MTQQKCACHIVLSNLLVLVASAAYLAFQYWAVGVVVALVWFYGAISIYIAVRKKPLVFCIATLLTIVCFSPMLVYGLEREGVLYFGSAFSVDYQQYLSVLYSLAAHGLPFQNPYWPGHLGYYHYGFNLPLAAIINILKLQGMGFFSYSYVFMAYVVAAVIEFFVVTYFLFFKRSLSWFFSASVAVFAASYKGLYGAASVFIFGKEFSNYDTSIGFKTLQNDVIFGVHYLYSGMFLLYVLSVLIENKEEKRSWSSIFACVLIAYIAPLINAFSTVELGCLLAAFFLIHNWRSPSRIFAKPLNWFCLVLLVFAYLGLKTLHITEPGLRSLVLSFEPKVVVELLWGVLVNFGALILLGLFDKNDDRDLWNLSILTAVFLTVFIMIVSIPLEGEGRFAISRRVGTFILLLLMINVKYRNFNWRTALILTPALMTFLGQNYYFFMSHNYPSRTVGVAKSLFGSKKGYVLDDLAYKVSDSYRFQFDMITQARAEQYPNSWGYKQYSHVDFNRDSKGHYKNVSEITFSNNIFKLKPTTK